MTPDTLEELVLAPQDFWPLQRALAPLTEKERAKLSPHAQKLYSQLDKNKVGDGASDRLKAFFANRNGDSWSYWNADANQAAALAMFGLCTGGVLKKRATFLFFRQEAVFERIIADRKPVWLDDWLAHVLDGNLHRLAFPIIRRWIKAGLCQKPETDGYYQLFASHMMRTPYHKSEEVIPPLSRQLLDDPDLLADIDGLFRVETIAFNTNSWLIKGAPKDYETWPDALSILSEQGHLERARLLRQALEGLRLDIKQNQLSGFHGLYRRLGPTAAEHLRHQPDYIALLCHPVGHVVKFALEMLAEVDKASALDTPALLDELPGVFAGESKGNATAALKLVGSIIARKDTFAEPALAAACEALRHANADVQAQALALIEKHAAAMGDAQREALGELEVFLAASNRHRLSALVSDRQAEVTPAPVRAADLEAYRPLSADINDRNLLFTEDRITPIGSLDALIDALLHAAEVVDSPDEVERIIDAIARLAGDRPADFVARTAPLRHRLLSGASGASGNKGIIPVYIGIGEAVRDLLVTWLDSTLVITPARKLERYETVEDGFVPLIAHLHWLARRVARGETSVLLSAPTHKGGFIDPLIWVERLKQVPLGAIDTMDLRLSLLRLAPDNRREAMATLAGVHKDLRRIADFALGGDEVPGKADRKAHPVWISAARCRAPYKDWSAEFSALHLNDAWGDSLKPAHFDWRASHTKQSHEGQTWKFAKLDIALEGATPAAKDKPGGFLAGLAQAVGGQMATNSADIPSAAIACSIDQESPRYWQSELQVVWLTRWLPFVWPQNPSAVHMKAAKVLVPSIDEKGSSWSPRFGFYHALFQTNRPWREAGHLLLSIGLAARDADAKGLAVDALIEGIDSRLFDPDQFAATITRLAAGEWLKLNRLGESLMTAVRISPLHAAVVGEAVQKWLPGFDHRQTNGFAILHVLLEVQAVTGLPLAEAALAHLGTITGSSKVAKLAQQLLKRDPVNRE
jgi:hypothetical protein